ncbi:MAG: glycosyltransferase family 2 protein [bacterium]
MIKKIGNYQDLEKKSERFIYRLFEILPGFLSWGTLIGVVALSYFWPFGIAIFIIVFDLYWLSKIGYLSIHLIVSYFKLKKFLKINWSKKCHQDLYHLIILPFYKEDLKVLRSTFDALIKSTYSLNKFIIILASEKRAGQEAFKRAKIIKKIYKNNFFKFLITRHPDNIPDELAGKGSNESWAGKQAKKLIDKLKLDYSKIICSVFDIDTCVHPQYFSCLTYHFQKQKDPHNCSYQPIAMYHNNLWDSPALMRVIATSNSFWQMMQQERPEKLCTFSSHSMSFKTVVDIGFWQENIVSEDSRIFFQCLFHFKGRYRVVPMFIPVYMDTVLCSSYWQSIKNQYKQQRRWGWGCENIAWVLYHSLKIKKMSLFIKLRHCFEQVEGFHSWATASLIIFALGWLPIALGGGNFNQTVLAFNLPKLTSQIMTLSMAGMVAAATISMLLLPKRPDKCKRHKFIFMLLQWLLLPITVTVFGSIPALEAQTRLMLGKYMGFFVTPKTRK